MRKKSNQKKATKNKYCKMRTRLIAVNTGDGYAFVETVQPHGGFPSVLSFFLRGESGRRRKGKATGVNFQPNPMAVFLWFFPFFSGERAKGVGKGKGWARIFGPTHGGFPSVLSFFLRGESGRRGKGKATGVNFQPNPMAVFPRFFPFISGERAEGGEKGKKGKTTGANFQPNLMAVFPWFFPFFSGERAKGVGKGKAMGVNFQPNPWRFSLGSFLLSQGRERKAEKRESDGREFSAQPMAVFPQFFPFFSGERAKGVGKGKAMSVNFQPNPMAVFPRFFPFISGERAKGGEKRKRQA